jgi:hydroxylamine reductase
MSMFCYQCEQTFGGTGCTKQGVCGKDATTAGLQDLLIFSLKGIARYAKPARELGTKDPEMDAWVQEALFATLTNVNFDAERFVAYVREAQAWKDKAKGMLQQAGGTVPEDLKPAVPAEASQEDLLGVAALVGILQDTHPDADATALRQLIILGLKGICAYSFHARELGKTDDGLDAFVYEALAATTDDSMSVEALVGLALKTGEINIKAMEILDAGHVEKLGVPEPAPVFLGTKAGPGILISGHDMVDLLELLKQTEGTGINIYTHGEMLPAVMYPELRKHPHLVGNWGSAWQNQQREFEEFPGPIVMTTNCLMKPRGSYKDRVFTLGPVGWSGVKHLGHSRDFSAVIAMAKELPPLPETEGKTILTGFHHLPVLSIADKVIEAVKGGAVKHFFLIGGCDGARPGRNYYTEFAEKVPQDCIILTLACGKYRFNKLDFGEIGGIPRLLDMGQCNNAYSAVQVALALANAFGVGVNDLPLSLVLSWYEQKAVAILLSLLHLGIKNIRLGPTLPAFVTPNVLDVLVKNFDIKPISTVDEDLAACLS